jgi:hypothetical protein
MTETGIALRWRCPICHWTGEIITTGPVTLARIREQLTMTHGYSHSAPANGLEYTVEFDSVLLPRTRALLEEVGRTWHDGHDEHDGVPDFKDCKRDLCRRITRELDDSSPAKAGPRSHVNEEESDLERDRR